MAADFRYPDGSQRIWRALDPRGPLAFGYSLSAIARLAPGLSVETAASLIEQRSAEIGRATGTLAASRWVRSQLFAVEPADPVTLVGVTLGVLAVAVIATWQPARQAARVDPRELLKG
jgi:hypothetical protein